MNLASKTASAALHTAIEGRAHPAQHGMADWPLHVGDDLPGIGLIPAPIEILGHRPELDNEVAGEILRLDLAAFLPPEPQQGGFIVAHDDPSVRAADERAPVDNFGHAIHDTPPSGSAQTNDCMYGFVDAFRRAAVIGARIGLVK